MEDTNDGETQTHSSPSRRSTKKWSSSLDFLSADSDVVSWDVLGLEENAKSFFAGHPLAKADLPRLGGQRHDFRVEEVFGVDEGTFRGPSRDGDYLSEGLQTGDVIRTTPDNPPMSEKGAVLSPLPLNPMSHASAVFRLNDSILDQWERIIFHRFGPT